jgi:hypothetical protein
LLRTRVTSFADFSPFAWLSTLGSFFEKLKKKHILCGIYIFPRQMMRVFHFDKMRVVLGVARWHVSITKIPTWVYFGWVWMENVGIFCCYLVYFTVTWFSLCPFGIFYGWLEYICPSLNVVVGKNLASGWATLWTIFLTNEFGRPVPGQFYERVVCAAFVLSSSSVRLWLTYLMAPCNQCDQMSLWKKSPKFWCSPLLSKGWPDSLFAYQNPNLGIFWSALE